MTKIQYEGFRWDRSLKFVIDDGRELYLYDQDSDDHDFELFFPPESVADLLEMAMFELVNNSSLNRDGSVDMPDRETMVGVVSCCISREAAEWAIDVVYRLFDRRHDEFKEFVKRYSNTVI